MLTGIKNIGTTHIWFTGILSHASTTACPIPGIPSDPPGAVKGIAGSPYAIRNYYDICPDLADNVSERMQEFEALIDRTHKAGLKVIIDFVPNHVARNYHSDTDNFTDDNFFILPNGDRLPGNPDWYDTIKLNYTSDTRLKMFHILCFWVSKGVDGFRCDMAEMVPLDFWSWVIPKVKEIAPVLFIAEIYQPDLYRPYLYEGHFDYLYDKVGLYDTLRAIICQQQSANSLTSCLEDLADIRPYMLHFLENHDEQRIASPFFAGNPFHAFPAMILLATVSTSPFMLYFGQELGEAGTDSEGFSGFDGRTTIFDYWSISSFRTDYRSIRQQQILRFHTELCHLALNEKAFTDGLFYNLSRFTGSTEFTYLRYYREEFILVALNFSGTPAECKIAIPLHAFEVCHIPNNQAMEAVDLLSGERRIAALTDVCPYTVAVPAYGGRIIKFMGMAQ
jgi:glycosidase